MRGVGWGRVRRFAGGPVPWIVLIASLVCGGVVYRQAQRFDGNLSGFICLGDRFLPPAQLPAGALVLKDSDGYDGTFFYVIARDPLILGEPAPFLDVPAYRYQRVGYPALVWLAALGRRARLPAAMVGVNLAAVLAGLLGVAALCRLRGTTPWYALFYVFLSGLTIGLLRDLAGPVAMAWLVWAVVAHAAGRYGTAGVLMAGAVLTRETLAVMLPVFWFDALVLRRAGRRGWLELLPLLPLLGWKAYVAARFGAAPWEAGARNLGPPFVALADHLRAVLGSPGHAPAEKVYLVLFLAASLLTVLLAAWELSRRRDAVALGLLGFSLLPVVLSGLVWVEPWAYGRVLLPGAVFLLLSLVWSRNRWHLAPLAMHVLLFFVFLDLQGLLWSGGSIVGRLWAGLT